MGGTLKPIAVIAGGVVLAVPMAWATFFAMFSTFGLHWSDHVERTWSLIASVAVMVVLLLWVIAWCTWKAAGWARFVSAALPLPMLVFLLRDATGKWLRAGRLASWSELRAGPMGPLEAWQFNILVIPALIGAVGILLLALVPARTSGEEKGRRFGPTIRSFTRGVAGLGAVVGAAALVGWFMVLVWAGIG